MIGDTERHHFQAMSEEDKLNALYDMIRYIRGKLASLEKELIGFQGDVLIYRQQREEREKTMTTTEKIGQELQSRFGLWYKIGANVLDKIITVIVLAILYLAFGGKMP